MKFNRLVPDATVVITTKNRCEELQGAITSALAQTAAIEVLVINDGSTDGTREMVQRSFPTVRLVTSPVSRGYIAQRNYAARIASAPIIVSIDDDARFDSSETVAETLAELDHPRVGAVAIPFINVRQDAVINQQAPQADKLFVAASFIGTAHALRRDLFIALGGYREQLFHQGEESDYSLRMLDAGYVVRLGNAAPIHHLESPRRDFRRMDIYGRRNDVLYAWHNVPLPVLGSHLVGTTLHGLVFGARVGRPGRMAWGLTRGFAAAMRYRRERRPVALATYRLHRLLKHRGPLLIEAIAELLRPACELKGVSGCLK